MAVDKNKISAEATRLVQKGQLDKAIRLYEKILAHDAADVRVLLKVGELQQKKGDSRAAGETFERCAEAYAQQGFLLKSVAVYKQILKLVPDDARVSERLAALYQQLGLASEAMAQLQLVASAAERGNDDARLLDVLRRIVELDPDHVASSVKLGEAYARLGQPKVATEHLGRAAEQLKRNSRIDEYVKVAERIAALVPEDWTLARELASILLARGEAKRALSRLQPCYKADPKNVDTLTLLGQAFQDLGQTSKLTSVYRELGRIHGQARDVESARGAWRHVLELAPDDPEAVEALGGVPQAGAVAAATSAEITSSSAAWGIPTSGTASQRLPPPAAADAPGAQRPPAQPTTSAAQLPTGGSAPATPQPGTGRVDAARILTETDVYLKYGLHEKALDHLQKLLADDPDHLDGREKASRIRELRNDLAGAADEALRVAQVALSAGLAARARAAFERARSLAPGHAGIAELSSSFQAETAAAEADTEGFVLEIDETALVTEGASPRRADVDDLALTAAAPHSDDVVDEPIVPTAAATMPEQPAAALADAAPGPPVATVDDASPSNRDEVAVAEPGDTLDEDLAEADFFIAQGLLDDARELLAGLEAARPGDPAIASRVRDLEYASEHAPARRDSPDPETSADGDDYLYSVRDVLEPFKKGVEKALTADDSATHYDLGIAYREMGLVDDAIQEFERAQRGGTDAARVDCLAMIGLCRLEKGDSGEAIAAYRQALRVGGVTADRRRSVEYHLASAYEASGDREAALHYLQRIVADDPGYRDAGAAVARLGGGAGRPPPDDEATAAGGGEPQLDATADQGIVSTGTQVRSA